MAIDNLHLLPTTRIVVRIFYVLNIVFGIVFAAILAAVLVAPGDAAALVSRSSKVSAADAAVMISALRLLMILGIAAAGLAHVILKRLDDMVAAIASGQPFVAGQAEALRVIAWALLGLNLLDLMFGATDLWVAQSTRQHMGWSPSFTGWFAVLLLFVLARVFDAGKQLSDDLEGTV